MVPCRACPIPSKIAPGTPAWIGNQNAFLLQIRSTPAKRSCSVKFPDPDIIATNIVGDLAVALSQFAEIAVDLRRS